MSDEEAMNDSSSSEIQKQMAKLHIEEIRTQKFSVGSDQANPLRNDLLEALTNLPKDANFLRELILNAEENEYEADVEPMLRIVMTEKDITGTGAPATLLLWNNEVGFSRENMDCICGINQSTKKGKKHQQTGQGFKSVFLVSSQPYIFSNGYHVRFQEAIDQDCGVGYIVPQWVSEPPLSSISDVLRIDIPATTIILPLKPELVDSVREQLSQLCPEILLFLSKLKCLHVRADRVSSFHKVVDSDRVQLSKKKLDDDTEMSCLYYMRKMTFPVKAEYKVDARKDVQNWVITIAFPSGDRMRTASSSVGIFSCLPITMVTNFPFLIQADFILNSSRDSILLNNVWNLGILSCIPSAFVNAFESLSFCGAIHKISHFLPAEASSIPEFNDLRVCIKTELQNLKMVPCEAVGTPSYVRPQEVVRVCPEFRRIVDYFKSRLGLLSLASLPMMILLSSLDLEKYNAVLEFLEVKIADRHWYTKCVESLCNLADKKVPGSGIILLLEYIKQLASSSPDDPFLNFLNKIIAKSKCLRILFTDSYDIPEECILFDSDWAGILKKTQINFSIDDDFHGAAIHEYKDQLRDIGVKVDPLSVCTFLYRYLSKQVEGGGGETAAFILSVYKFMNEFQWRPEAGDETPAKIFLYHSEDGDWEEPIHCVLHDGYPPGADIESLDDHYDVELLPFFSSAFGVAEYPTLKHYIRSWNNWDHRRAVTLKEYCFNFWQYVVDNWNPTAQEKLRKNLAKLPATRSTSEKIYQIKRGAVDREVFIADDLRLKSIFLSFDKYPLFVWFPSSNHLWGRTLNEIYEFLGVRKLSDSVDISLAAPIDMDTEAKVVNGLINKGLIKIILGFLAGSQVDMPVEERKKAASLIVELIVYELNKPYEQIYSLMQRPQSAKEVCLSRVTKVKLVTWDMGSKRLIIDSSGYNNGKFDPRFVLALGDELAQGLLKAWHGEASVTLSRIIRSGFLSGFNEQEADRLLINENLKLSLEDEKFLDAAFPSSTDSGPASRKRSSMERDQSGPSSSTSSSKKRH